MSRDRWRQNVGVHLPDDVHVEVESTESTAPWLTVADPEDAHRVTLFGSSIAARRIAEGASAWADAIEAREQEQDR